MTAPTNLRSPRNEPQDRQAAADLPFAGVELIRVDKNITEVLIGGKLRIKVANTYSSNLELLVEAPFETATRYRVTANIDGFDSKVIHFENEYEATSSVQGFEGKGATATFEKVDVLIDDAGNVVGDSEPAPHHAALETDVPF